MPIETVRPLAVCVCREGDRVLLEWGRDDAEDEDFLRPIGGGIELGESPEEAVRREYREEYGAELGEIRLAGILDNAFTYEDRPGHELIYVYTGHASGALAGSDHTVESVDADGLPHVAQWVALAALGADGLAVYPEELPGMLRDAAARAPAPGAPARPAWHRLLAPLPDGAIPERRPVAPPELRDAPSAAAIAGWEQVTLHLSEPGRCLRHLLVVLDAGGRVISGSDLVHERLPLASGGAAIHQQSIGGRFEPDGSFLGTCWQTAGPDPEGDEEPRWLHAASAPSVAHSTLLAELAAELVRRSR